MILKLKFASFFALGMLLFTACNKEETEPLLPPTVNAGETQIVQLPTNTVTLSGSGTATNTPITGYLWSLISGPNIPGIVSPSSTSTIVNNLIAGTYFFQFQVIDNAGLTGVDTVSVTVLPASVTTLTLQPSSNPDEGHVDSYNVTGGQDTDVEIGAWTIFGVATKWRSYIKFDQSQLPANATIINATLYLYAMPNPHSGDGTNAMCGSANSYWVERITGSWSVTSLNFSSLPPTTTISRVAIPQSTSSFENSTIDVTALVQDMQVNGNYGFGFKLQDESVYNFRAYASSFHSNAQLHPKLVIAYQ